MINFISILKSGSKSKKFWLKSVAKKQKWFVFRSHCCISEHSYMGIDQSGICATAGVAGVADQQRALSMAVSWSGDATMLVGKLDLSKTRKKGRHLTSPYVKSHSLIYSPKAFKAYKLSGLLIKRDTHIIIPRDVVRTMKNVVFWSLLILFTVFILFLCASLVVLFYPETLFKPDSGKLCKLLLFLFANHVCRVTHSMIFSFCALICVKFVKSCVWLKVVEEWNEK